MSCWECSAANNTPHDPGCSLKDEVVGALGVKAETKPEVCRVCGFAAATVTSVYEGTKRFCSRFCEETTEAEKIAFLTLRVGEYGTWPCRECGAATEGDYTGPDDHCGGCSPKVQIRVFRRLLERVVENFGHRTGLVDDHRFIDEISKALKK
jgi:hypothetical protein